MAAPPVELFALRIEPGQTVPVDTERDVVITNVCFASEEALKPGQTTILKVHHVKVDQDSDDDEDDDEQDDEDDDEDEELPDASASSGKAKTPAKKAATEGGPNKKQDEEDSDEEEDNDDDLDGVVEQEYSLARLTTGQTEQVTINLQLSSEELVALSVAGPNAQAVDVLGSYLAPPQGYDREPSSDSEIDSDYADSDEDDEDDDDSEESDHESEHQSEAISPKDAGGDDDDDDDEDDDSSAVGSIVEEFPDSHTDNILPLQTDLKRILAGDLGSEDEDASEAEDASGRIQEIQDAAPQKKKALPEAAPAKTTGKRGRESTGEDAEAELAKAAKAEGLDPNALSKGQRKRLSKKLRGEDGAAAEPSVAKEGAAEGKKAEKKPEKKAEKKAGKKDEDGKPEEQSSGKRTIAGGLIIEDKKVGSGAVAKHGSRVGMRYVGKLTSGKIFDQNTSGKPFSFKLGAGQVISGWDKGLIGMSVGSERRLTIPPAMAYGKSGAAPVIPPNATLVFDVKLVSLK